MSYYFYLHDACDPCRDLKPEAKQWLVTRHSREAKPLREAYISLLYQSSSTSWNKTLKELYPLFKSLDMKYTYGEHKTISMVIVFDFLSHSTCIDIDLLDDMSY